LIKLKKLPA